jgi:hypothetical protein
MHDIETKLRCPKCKRPLALKLRELIPGTTKTCPHGCGATLEFTGDDGRKVQGALDNVSRALQRIGRR